MLIIVPKRRGTPCHREALGSVRRGKCGQAPLLYLRRQEQMRWGKQAPDELVSMASAGFEKIVLTLVIWNLALGLLRQVDSGQGLRVT